MEEQQEQLKIVLIRPAMTPSGKEQHYLGWTDESLLETEIERIAQRKKEGVYPEVSRVYSSRVERCRQTSYIIYNKIPAIVIPGFQPFDYGEFEGKTYSELLEDPEYREVLLTDGMLTIPNGESPFHFSVRVNTTFKRMVDEIRPTAIRKVAVVTHESVILSILRKYVMPRSIQQISSIEYGGGVVLCYDYYTGAAVILRIF